MSWQHKRHRLVAALAKLDAQVAARAHALEESWVEKYRLAPHEIQQTPPAAAPAAPTPEPPASSAAQAAPVQPIPEYLL